MPRMTPMTIPAIAPPLKVLLLLDVSVPVMTDVGVTNGRVAEPVDVIVVMVLDVGRIGALAGVAVSVTTVVSV